MGCFFVKDIEWKLGENWIVATKKEKLQPNEESCNENTIIILNP
jgi:hypothetical protein